MTTKTKKANEIASKSALDSTDFLFLESASGMRKISKANAESWVKNTVKINDTVTKLQSGQWIRFLEFPAPSVRASQFLLMVNNSFFNIPSRATCVLVSLWINSTKSIFGNVVPLNIGNTKQFRVVQENDKVYMELYCGTTDDDSTTITVLGNGHYTQMTPVVSNADTSAVKRSDDFSTQTQSLNNQNMQVTDLQDKNGGGYLEYPFPVPFAEKGGLPDGQRTDFSRLPEVAPDGHLYFRSIDDLCRFIGETEEGSSIKCESNDDVRYIFNRNGCGQLSDCRNFFDSFANGKYSGKVSRHFENDRSNIQRRPIPSKTDSYTSKIVCNEGKIFKRELDFVVSFLFGSLAPGKEVVA